MLMEEKIMGFELQGLLTAAVPAGFDLSQKMSTSSLICAGLNLLITIAIPIVFILYLRKRARLELKSLLIGGLSYILMNKIVLNIIGIGISMIPGFQQYMQVNVSGTQIISVVLSFLMEFLAILLGLIWIRRKKLTFNDCMMFIFGYTCIVILTETVAQTLAMLINCVAINVQGLEAIFAQIPEEDVSIAVDAYRSVLDANPVEFLVEGMNCFIQFLIRACSCILIYASLTGKSGKQNIFVTLFALMLYYIPIAVYAAQIIPSRLIVEIMFLVVLAVVVFYTYTVLKKELADDWNEFQSGKNKKNKPNKNQPQKMPKIVMPKD